MNTASNICSKRCLQLIPRRMQKANIDCVSFGSLGFLGFWEEFLFFWIFAMRHALQLRADIVLYSDGDLCKRNGTTTFSHLFLFMMGPQQTKGARYQFHLHPLLTNSPEIQHLRLVSRVWQIFVSLAGKLKPNSCSRAANKWRHISKKLFINQTHIII